MVMKRYWYVLSFSNEAPFFIRFYIFYFYSIKFLNEPLNNVIY